MIQPSHWRVTPTAIAMSSRVFASRCAVLGVTQLTIPAHRLGSQPAEVSDTSEQFLSQLQDERAHAVGLFDGVDSSDVGVIQRNAEQ